MRLRSSTATPMGRSFEKRGLRTGKRVLKHLHYSSIVGSSTRGTDCWTQMHSSASAGTFDALLMCSRDCLSQYNCSLHHAQRNMALLLRSCHAICSYSTIVPPREQRYKRRAGAHRNMEYGVVRHGRPPYHQGMGGRTPLWSPDAGSGRIFGWFSAGRRWFKSRKDIVVVLLESEV
jgi:hypothetical protein